MESKTEAVTKTFFSLNAQSGLLIVDKSSTKTVYRVEIKNMNDCKDKLG